MCGICLKCSCRDSNLCPLCHDPIIDDEEDDEEEEKGEDGQTKGERAEKDADAPEVVN